MQPQIEQTLRQQVKEAINGYGIVVGLQPNGPGQLIGSLDRVLNALERLVEAAERTEPAVGDMAAHALSLVEQREGMNGTIQEQQYPERFAKLTTQTREALADLRERL